MEELTTHEKDLLLAVIKHYMSMELRGKIMKELPSAYNKWMKKSICTVVHTSKLPPDVLEAARVSLDE